MADDVMTTTGIARHGAARLPSVEIDSFNIEIKDEDGFLGDRASKGAFRKILERWRKPLRKSGKDPFGDEDSDTISKKALDAILDDPDHARELGHNGIRRAADFTAASVIPRVEEVYRVAREVPATAAVVTGPNVG